MRVDDGEKCTVHMNGPVKRLQNYQKHCVVDAMPRLGHAGNDHQCQTGSLAMTESVLIALQFTTDDVNRNRFV